MTAVVRGKFLLESLDERLVGKCAAIDHPGNCALNLRPQWRVMRIKIEKSDAYVQFFFLFD